ncbi:DMT family transporter [Nocardiopsis alba]|uniref:DMT family transporter n=1 Tax=Nocardiopsis alba TaxID=53437 RepID=UPI00380920AA
MSPSTATTSTTRMGVIELTTAMLISGTVGVFVVESGADPFTVAFFRCVFGAAALALYCLARGYLRDTGFTARTFLLALLGGVFLVFNWVFLFMSYSMTSISVATVVYHTQPFYVLLLGAVVFKERLTRTKIGWTVLAFAGFLLVTDPTDPGSGSGYALGVALALTAALLYALTTIIAKHLKNIRPHVIALVQVLAGIPLLLPFTDTASLPGLGTGWAWLVGIGLLHTFTQYVLMYSGYQKLSTHLIAVLSFVYPAMAIIVDMFVYGTAIGALQTVGIALIVLASLADSLAPQPKTPSTTDTEPARAPTDTRR